MYIDLGKNAVLTEKEIIGIFDMETATVSVKTRDFLNNAEKNGKTVTTSGFDFPRSFTVAAKGMDEQKIVISPLSVPAVCKNIKNV